MLKYGRVVVDVDYQTVELIYKEDLMLHVFDENLMNELLISHYHLSKDIYWAFNKLIEENEAPAIIFADLLVRLEQRN